MNSIMACRDVILHREVQVQFVQVPVAETHPRW